MESTRVPFAPGAARSSGPVSEPVAVPRADVPKPAPKEADRPTAGFEDGTGEYELVLGRSQIASCLFAGTVLIAIFTGAAYFAGKMSTPSCVAASSSVPALTIPPVTQAPPSVPAATVPAATVTAATVTAATMMRSAPALTAGVGHGAIPFVAKPVTAEPKVLASVGGGSEETGAVREPQAVANTNSAGTLAAGELPLFADRQPGAIYLQMGAVDKGMAIIIAEGLRQRGFSSFVAPGPNEKIFRVLIGPFASQDDYKRVKAEADTIDVNTLIRSRGDSRSSGK